MPQRHVHYRRELVDVLDVLPIHPVIHRPFQTVQGGISYRAFETVYEYQLVLALPDTQEIVHLLLADVVSEVSLYDSCKALSL
mgnify:FL=1